MLNLEGGHSVFLPSVLLCHQSQNFSVHYIEVLSNENRSYCNEKAFALAILEVICPCTASSINLNGQSLADILAI